MKKIKFIIYSILLLVISSCSREHDTPQQAATTPTADITINGVRYRYVAAIRNVNTNNTNYNYLTIVLCTENQYTVGGNMGSNNLTNCALIPGGTAVTNKLLKFSFNDYTSSTFSAGTYVGGSSNSPRTVQTQYFDNQTSWIGTQGTSLQVSIESSNSIRIKGTIEFPTPVTLPTDGIVISYTTCQ